MSDKNEDSEHDSDSQENSNTKLTPGNLLAFGSINLTFSLILKKQELKQYKIQFDSLKSLEDIKFLIKHKKLAKRVDISSKNDVMNILLNINKSAKKLLKIGYVSYKKINYKEEQEDFKDFEIQLESGDSLYFMSDGIKDQTNPEREKFKNKYKYVEILCTK